MGRHESPDRRRGIAAWPIVIAVVVLLVAGFAIVYFIVVGRSNPSAGCTGNTVLPVTASPGARRSIEAAAGAFNATHPSARSTCVSVSVTVTDGATAAAALAAGWQNRPTPAPGLWVVDSPTDLATVDSSDPSMTAGHSEDQLATSPVVLAVRTGAGAGSTAPAGSAETVAPTGGSSTGGATGPLRSSWLGLATAATGTAGTPGTPGTPTLMLPDPRTNRASTYALESMVAAARDKGTSVSITAVDAAAVTASEGLLSSLAATAAPMTTDAALTALATNGGASYAVPVVESDLAAFNSTHQATGGSGPALSALYPDGATAADELLAVPLTAAWVTDSMRNAAAAFDAYLKDPAGTAVLAANHLRTAITSPAVPGLELSTRIAFLAAPTAVVRSAIWSAWAAK